MGFLHYLHSCMQDKVLCGVAQSKVVGGQLGVLGIEGSLVTSQPTFIAQNGGGIDQWTVQININIGIDLNVFMAIGNLEFASLVTRLWGEGTFEGQFQTFEQFVLHGNLGEEGVVCVPFFGQSQTIIVNFVFGLQ